MKSRWLPILCSLSIPAIIIAAGWFWATAPTQAFDRDGSYSPRDAMVTLVDPESLSEPEDQTEWAFVEVRARATVVGILGLISLAGSVAYIVKRRKTNRTTQTGP